MLTSEPNLFQTWFPNWTKICESWAGLKEYLNFSYIILFYYIKMHILSLYFEYIFIFLVLIIQVIRYKQVHTHIHLPVFSDVFSISTWLLECVFHINLNYMKWRPICLLGSIYTSVLIHKIYVRLLIKVNFFLKIQYIYLLI